MHIATYGGGVHPMLIGGGVHPMLIGGGVYPMCVHTTSTPRALHTMGRAGEPPHALRSLCVRVHIHTCTHTHVSCTHTHVYTYTTSTRTHMHLYMYTGGGACGGAATDEDPGGRLDERGVHMCTYTPARIHHMCTRLSKEQVRVWQCVHHRGCCGDPVVLTCTCTCTCTHDLWGRLDCR